MPAPLPEVWREGVVLLKTTDSKGSQTFTRHRCWNKDRFISSCSVAAIEAGGSCDQVTPEEYRNATGKAP